MGSFALAGAFLGSAIAGPFILFSWLVRRACLARLQPRWAALGGGLYVLFLLAGGVVLWTAGVLTPLSAFMLQGAAGLTSAMWTLRRLQPSLERTDGAGVTRDEVLRDHWRYGRWAIASSGLSWVPGNLYYVLLPAFAGLEATAGLKALSTLVLPILHLNAALSTMLLPALSAAARQQSNFTQLVTRSLVVLTGGSLLYGALVTVFRVPIIEWLYRGAYTDSAALMPTVALLPVMAACIAVLGSALRALDRPHLVFWTYVASTTATVTFGVWAVATWGSRGAATGLVLSSAVTAGMCGLFLLRYRHRQARNVASEALSVPPDSGVAL
jgi:O-antigen/teichoic acid export membrane protein